MKTRVVEDRLAMGRWVADRAAADLRAAIQQRGEAVLVVATGASQFQVLEALIAQPDLAWDRIDGFHLDEYLGLSPDHPASFCGYLQQRLVSQVPLRSFHYLRGDHDPQQVLSRANAALAAVQVDVALVGIGENGHLAFNDPPADFTSDQPYLIVQLDEKCRQQQVGEGWFDDLSQVPSQAISMSIRQILRSRSIYCSVPDSQKAAAVKATLEGPIDPAVPASILRTHPHTTLVLDRAAAALLDSETWREIENDHATLL